MERIFSTATKMVTRDNSLGRCGDGVIQIDISESHGVYVIPVEPKILHRN